MTGSYIWIPASAKNVESYPGAEVCLCVVGYFHGPNCVCYQVFNGVEIQTPEWRIQQVAPKLVNFLSKIKAFQKFRKSAAESNVNVTTWAVGTPFIDLCFGQVEGFEIHYVPRKEPKILEATSESKVLPTAGLIVNASQTVGGGFGESGGESKDPKDNTNSLYFAIGLVGACALAYFLVQ
jgi:hypothetical protein